MTDTLFMVRPAGFAFNDETAANNAFQAKGREQDIALTARAETDRYIALLRRNGITVAVAEDTPTPHTPDAVFPNNWFSVHEDGTLVLYPMFAENRRLERKPAALDTIRRYGHIRRVIDLTHYERDGSFLEGTGSLVLDRDHHLLFACRSPRTSEVVLEDFCRQLGYTAILFDGTDRHGVPIYHTNVMMNIGRDFAVVCLEAIRDGRQRQTVEEALAACKKEVVAISEAQMQQYAGNMLEVQNHDGEQCLLLSRTALNSLSPAQKDFLQNGRRLIVPDIPCIEKNGGGSARCMVAELF